MIKLLKYMHPSATQYDPRVTYSLEDLKKELPLKRIKLLFEPINFDFDEDDETDKKGKKNDKIIDKEEINNDDFIEDLGLQEIVTETKEVEQ